MTLHCWQHWFWITAAVPAILLVLTSLRASSATSVPWEGPASVWTSTAWLHSGPPGAPPVWTFQRRLLGFAMPQPPSAGASAPTLAGATPTIEALVYTLSPPVPAPGALNDRAPDLSAVPSDNDAQNKSSQSVNTTSSTTPAPSPSPSPPPSPAPSQKTPPSKPPRPKVIKTYVASMPKTSMAVKPAKLPTSTTVAPVVAATNASAAPTTVAHLVERTNSSTTPATPSSSTDPPETSTTEDVILDPPAELMNDSPVDAAATPAPMTPGSASSGAGVAEVTSSASSTSSPPAPSSSKLAPTSSAAVPVPTEIPHRREQSRDLGIVHPGVSFDNVSKQHALAINENYGGLDAGSIIGIAFGVVLFAALVGTASFILYRRRFLNKPQTLNDKCSNPDSSGYIDDSTLRENSEEMYSLDNDSFLNSLEAMTIQNYWTDSVKHTKL